MCSCSSWAAQLAKSRKGRAEGINTLLAVCTLSTRASTATGAQRQRQACFAARSGELVSRDASGSATSAAAVRVGGPVGDVDYRAGPIILTSAISIKGDEGFTGTVRARFLMKVSTLLCIFGAADGRLLGLMGSAAPETTAALPPAWPTEPIGLSWSDLSFVVKTKKGEKTVLHPGSGAAQAGRMLAIMGPSGCGKTSILNALAGQVRATKGARLMGTMRCGGELCGGASTVDGLRSAYVKQEDIFYTQMTVRETLEFAARLRLPKSVSRAEKKVRVDKLLSQLSLVKAADTVVGDVSRRGISGGERKRLAIGCELLSDPQLLFLDEPTSGLDSFQAQQVVACCKDLADRGTTVVMSIHQPRGSIYNMFDDLLLLSEGRTVYGGHFHLGRRALLHLRLTCVRSTSAPPPRPPPTSLVWATAAPPGSTQASSRLT